LSAEKFRFPSQFFPVCRELNSASNSVIGFVLSSKTFEIGGKFEGFEQDDFSRKEECPLF
jgi:hypothetical protein